MIDLNVRRGREKSMILTFPMHEIIVAFEDFGGFMRPKQEKKKSSKLTMEIKDKWKLLGGNVGKYIKDKQTCDYSPHKTQRKLTSADEWVWQMCLIFLPM